MLSLTLTHRNRNFLFFNFFFFNFDFQKYPALTLEVAGDLRRAPVTFENTALTASNYEEAIAILKKRFGNKQQIINRHMDILVNVSPVINEDTRKLRELYDTLESHVRSLKSLGLPSGSYRSLPSSIIMSKLPQELRLIISGEIRDQEWQLDTIMRVLESELEARELAVRHDESLLSAEGQAFPNFKMGTTTSALFTTHSGPTCTYCKQSHPSNSCKMVTNPAARKDIPIKQGRCFVCLRKDHLSKNCPSKLPRCYFQGIQDKVVSCSLHGIGDASTKTYAAVIYLHVTMTVGGYVKLVASKSRVAPVKELTIPRLELLAALVLAGLITHVKEALELDATITNMPCWTLIFN